MAIFNEVVTQQLGEMLEELQDEVYLLFFTQKDGGELCEEGLRFVEEFAQISPKIKLEIIDSAENPELARSYGVDKVPAMILLDKDRRDHGIKYYGIPGGYEINSFLTSLAEVSGRREALSESLQKRIAQIDKDIHLQVFVTMTCPYCPNAVASAHRLALENPHIRAEMVDASFFPDLSEKYGVMGVPMTVINEEKSISGAVPLSSLVEALEQV